jgi:hypothetical protein
MANRKIDPEARVCPACGKQFYVGGRGRPPRRQRLCSLDCQQRARIRKGTRARKLSAAEKCYLAGFIDGEGSIMLYDRDARRTSIRVRMVVTNTNLAVLEWMREVTRVGRINIHQADDGRRKTSWNWTTDGDGAASILEQIVEVMRVKNAQAELAITVNKQLADVALKWRRDWQVEARGKMQALNARGSRS